MYGWSSSSASASSASPSSTAPRFGIKRIAEFYGASEGNVAFANLMNKDQTIGMTAATIARNQDYDNAVLIWTSAVSARPQNQRGQFNLGTKHGNGEGVTQDYVQAHMWFNLAAAQGVKIGREYRDLVAKEMTPADISKAEALAREWMEKHQE